MAAGPARDSEIAEVIVLAKRSVGSGNRSTSDRLSDYLRDAGFCVTQTDTCAAVGEPSAEESTSRLGTAKCCVGLHAYHAGRFLVHGDTPYVIVFGGTDIYSDAYRTEPLLTQMRNVVREASAVVAFTAHMQRVAFEIFQVDSKKIHVIPQAVRPVPIDDKFSIADLGLWPEQEQPKDLFLLPSGLRPIKDVLYLVKAFEQWKRARPDVALLILGDVFDEAYAATVLAALEHCEGVRWFKALPQPALFKAYTECRAVINSSLSEGQCGALLEAMCYACPIIARRNAGNEELLQHDVSIVTTALRDSKFKLM